MFSAWPNFLVTAIHITFPLLAIRYQCKHDVLLDITMLVRGAQLPHNAVEFRHGKTVWLIHLWQQTFNKVNAV